AAAALVAPRDCWRGRRVHACPAGAEQRLRRVSPPSPPPPPPPPSPPPVVMNPASNCLRRWWSWLKLRVIALLDLIFGYEEEHERRNVEAAATGEEGGGRGGEVGERQR